MAKKKDFTQKDAESVDIVEAIRDEKTADKKDTPTYRFTSRFNKEEWQYLTEYHWQKRVTITDIIRRLVQEDMKKHPEIMETVDELNTNPGKEFRDPFN